MKIIDRTSELAFLSWLAASMFGLALIYTRAYTWESRMF